MNTIIRLAIIIVLALNPTLTYASPVNIPGTESDNTNLHFKEETKGDNKKDGPRMPSLVPVAGILYDDMITVSCVQEGEATVELKDADGISIYSVTVADLRNGLSLPAVVYGRTAASVRVLINDGSYVASLMF